jgi:eukaryotic-like serine/threonine-protein kinase
LAEQGEAADPGPSAGSPPTPGDPERVGPYQLLWRLGAGGMGTVFLGRRGDGPRVAVKVLRPELARDPSFLRMFRQEVAAARRVVSFCTARVLEADVTGPLPYLVTEYVEGVRLDRAITGSGRLSGTDLEGLAVGMAAALTAIHGAGVVHRDLKPSNVLLSYFGPKVIDFGIARGPGRQRQHGHRQAHGHTGLDGAGAVRPAAGDRRGRHLRVGLPGRLRRHRAAAVRAWHDR